jgi:hypothetical protein
MMPSPFFLPILLCLVPLAAAAQYPGFDVRYGIPAGTDLSALIGRPALISMSAEKFKDPSSGEWRLRGFGQAHGVYDVPLAKVLDALDDASAPSAYSPRLLQSRVEERDGLRVVLNQEVGILFLGIKVGYRFRAERVRDDLAPGEVGYRYRLLESLDGNMFEAYTSWYAKEVVVGGRRLVYLRAYSSPGLRKPGFGLEFIVRSFTPGELKGTLDNVAKEARRRASAPGIP